MISGIRNIDLYAESGDPSSQSAKEPQNTQDVQGAKSPHFTVNGIDLAVSAAAYGKNDDHSAILFEGEADGTKVMLLAAALDEFSYDIEYRQADFGDEIEVAFFLVNAASGEQESAITAAERGSFISYR